MDLVDATSQTLEYTPVVRQDKGKLVEQRPQFKQASDCRVLQQAAELTNGLYIRLPFQSDIFPSLLQNGFLASPQTRSALVV